MRLPNKKMQRFVPIEIKIEYANDPIRVSKSF